MCARESAPEPVDDGDDVWGGDSSSEGGEGRAELGREWEARRSTFYNVRCCTQPLVARRALAQPLEHGPTPALLPRPLLPPPQTGFREGMDEGRELTLAHGFNAGFAEGARAGFEWGLVKGALQTLAARHEGPPERAAQAQALLARLSALPTKAVMQETCVALLEQPPAPDVAQQLTAALQALALGDDTPDAAAAGGSGSAAAAADARGGGGAGGSGAAAAGADAPAGGGAGGPPGAALLLAQCREELAAMGFDVGGAPPLASPEPAAGAVDAAPAGDGRA
ncbi:hypothetical protein HT031_001963 [Scenedesmus sp. PABB004]|nr:hypothetical protein HT031_001963 [Scenedesmus sp. PABB004]